MSSIFTVSNLHELHQLLGLSAPEHPLISIIDLSMVQADKSYEGQKINIELYGIYLKDHCFGNLTYGRQQYDFQSGAMVFTSPNQVLTIKNMDPNVQMEGWSLFFHPDLIRKSALAENIHDFSFFSYDTNEALHLSDKEKTIMNQLVEGIRMEYQNNLDEHSHRLMTSNLELLLNYAKRFYNRQFLTREHESQDVTEQLKKFLYKRIYSQNLRDEGIPSVKECAEELCLSPNYLSDLLKKETGKNTKEHIYIYLIERAKTLLLNSQNGIHEIAYTLGFEYPEYFSKLFKKKTGMTPSFYRDTIQ